MSPTEHECTLIQLMLNPPSCCQVTNNSFPPCSRRVSKTIHSSIQFQHLFSRDLHLVTELLWELCVHISSCFSHRPFSSEKPRDAAICRMSCLKKPLSIGDSARISVRFGSVKPLTTRRAFACFSCVFSHFPRVNPAHRHESLLGNACSLADRDHIVADPLMLEAVHIHQKITS